MATTIIILTGRRPDTPLTTISLERKQDKRDRFSGICAVSAIPVRPADPFALAERMMRLMGISSLGDPWGGKGGIELNGTLAAK